MPLASLAPATAEKHPGAFRTIGEVADDLGVPQHVLRFWESRFGQIRPLKRAGGRRFYRPEDVELVSGIRHLLHVQRYTIEGAQRVLKANGVRFVQAVGRGEAVAATPQEAEAALEALHEALPEALPETSCDADADASGASLALLRDLLGELHACRAALAALREAPDAPA